jgi:hypothetical protein
MERFDIRKEDRNLMKTFPEFLNELKTASVSPLNRLSITGKLYDSLFRHFLPRPNTQVIRKEQIAGLKRELMRGGISDPVITVDILGMLRLLLYDDSGSYQANAQRLEDEIEKRVQRFTKQHSLDYDIESDPNRQFLRIRVYTQRQRGIPSAKRSGIL